MAPRRAAVLRSVAQPDQATLREHLVASTERLLEQGSLAALTTRAIARHAGVSDGVLYNHFADKRELLVAALVRRYGRLLERLEATAPRAGEGSVEANLHVLARALSTLEADAILLGAGLLADPPLLQRFWLEIHRPPFGLDRVRRPLLEYLRAERQLGRLAAATDVEAAVTVIFGTSAMVALTRRLQPDADRATLDGRLDAAVSALVRGIGARTPA